MRFAKVTQLTSILGEETRRSARATKGQHKAHEDSAEPNPKPKKTGKGKASKKASEPEPSEEEDEKEEVIRCVCGHNEDDTDGMMFIACETCDVWQHNICMGVTTDEDQQPDNYFCEQCQPDDHKELLEAMARGEKPWLERQRAAKLAAKNRRKSGGKKNNAKGTQQSKVSDIKPKAETAVSSSPVPGPPAATQESGNKRKFVEEVPQVSDIIPIISSKGD